MAKLTGFARRMAVYNAALAAYDKVFSAWTEANNARVGAHHAALEAAYRKDATGQERSALNDAYAKAAEDFGCMEVRLEMAREAMEKARLAL